MGGLFVKEKPSALRVLFEKYREIIMYCVFGVITTVINWLVYSLCEVTLPSVTVSNSSFEHFVAKLIALLGDNTDVDTFVSMTLAGIIAWVVAVAVAFVTNKLWVFQSKSWDGKLVTNEALTFFGGRVATGLLEIIAVPTLVGWGFNFVLFGVNGLPAKIVISVIIVILNYILSKFISFRGTTDKA